MSDTNDDTLIGARIVGIRAMTDEEQAQKGWEHRRGGVPVVIVLDDGSELFTAMDGEFNGPGVLIHENDEGQFMILPPRKVEDGQ